MCINQVQRHLFVFIIVSLLFSCTSSSKSFANNVSPCWFNEPVSDNNIGFIGAASPFSAKFNGSLTASRQKALSKLLAFYSLEYNDDNDLVNNAIILSSGKRVLFSQPYSDHQAMYSYAILETKQSESQREWLNQTCPTQTCSFNRCSPEWLCAKTDNHIISVSQPTSNPAKQLDKTHENAQTFLQYVTKSKVDDYTYQVKSEGEHQQWGYSEHKGQIKALGSKNQLLNTHSCQTNSYMFARYRYSDSKNENLLDNKIYDESSKPFTIWSKEPSFNGKVGVVGIFSGITADGLFSSAIKHSIKDGLLALAKIKQINIDHNYQIHRQNGLFSLAKTTMTTSALVSATLQDIKIIEKNDKLIIYTWLIEE